MIGYKGYYYFTCSNGKNLKLWKTRDLADLDTAESRVVWAPPPDTEYSEQIWAPELHQLDHKWYLYFAADDGENRHHHIFVLENAADDPFTGEWTLKGMVVDPSYRWAIDPAILSQGNKNYLVWSGWPDTKNVIQNLYIAELKNPWTIKGSRKLISTPTESWEKHVGMTDPTVEVPRRGVNEGPEPLIHNGKIFMVYSASGCWTDHYGLGMLTLEAGKNPMKQHSWVKSKDPVFSADAAGGTYGPGHNGFFASPDGTQDWIIYHANSLPGQGCGDTRSVRMQRFDWNEDGTPNFAMPLPIDTPIAEPSGSPEP